MPDLTNPLSQEGLERIAAGLTDAQRQRLLDWPDHGSTFWNGPDAIADQLCELGIGVIMPWRPSRSRHHCQQMGLTSGVGIPVHLLLKGHEHA